MTVGEGRAGTGPDGARSIELGDNPPPGPLSLTMLSRDVREARAAVHVQRHGPVVATELATARRALMIALEEYTSALEQRHLPVPHALHMELDMQRQLFDL